MRAEGSVLQRDADLPRIVLTAAHSTDAEVKEIGILFIVGEGFPAARNSGVISIALPQPLQMRILACSFGID